MQDARRYSMRSIVSICFCGFLTAAALISGCAGYGAARPAPEAEDPSRGGSTAAGAGAQWSMNATAIEACSCPMFCQCYFNPEPAVHSGNEGIHKGHEQGHYCRFNMAYRVNRGSYGTTKLDGAKFWIGGDLGGDFRKGQTDWAVLTFDPSVTKAQRDGITATLGKLFPVKWRSFTVGPDAPITWQATKDAATATLGGVKTRV